MAYTKMQKDMDKAEPVTRKADWFKDNEIATGGHDVVNGYAKAKGPMRHWEGGKDGYTENVKGG